MCIPYFFREFLDEIESSIENNINLDIKMEVDKLVSFCFSKNFIPYLSCEFQSKNPFQFVISLFECKEQFFSMKLLFPFLEELKKRKFDIYDIMKNIGTSDVSNFMNNDNDDLGEFMKKLSDVNDTNNYKNTQAKKPDTSRVVNLFGLYSIIFKFVFKDDLKKFDANQTEDKINENFKNYFNSIFELIKEDLQLIFDNLYALNSLYYNNNIYQSIIFLLNYARYKQEISLIDSKNNNILSKYYNETPFNLKFDKIIWIIYEKNKDNKFETLQGEIEKEALYYDYYAKINEYNNKNIIAINNNIYESLFYKHIIRIIKIDYNLVKEYNISIERIQSDIKSIIDLCPYKDKNIKTYCQFDNKIINLDNSYDIFLNELKNKNIIDKEKKIKIINNKINENIKVSNEIINQNQIKSNDNIESNNLEELKSQLNKERNDNKKLNEKIKLLEKELKEEKNKNILNEKHITDLKNQLDNEIKKNNDFIADLEQKKLSQKKYEKETKESFLDIIMEKDKEIKELKLKLSRFPFILEQGEKIMSIIFQSSVQSIHSAVICKNTDKLSKIEGLLCEKNPKFTETENFFFLNGTKMFKNKTLE